MTFLAPHAYPFAHLLEEHFESIHAEATRLAAAEYRRWVLEEAFTGDWRIFPLYFNDASSDMADNCEANRARCPQTSALLARIHGLLIGGFSTLGRRSRIHPHEDYPGVISVRTHLGIQIPAGCTINMDGVTRGWQRGRVLAFDGRTPHHADNPTDQDRIVLLVDVEASRAMEPPLRADQPRDLR